MSNLIQCNIFFVRPGKVRIPRYIRYHSCVLDMYWNTGLGSLYHCNDLALYKIGQSVGGNEPLNAHLELLGPCFDTHRGQCVISSSLCCLFILSLFILCYVYFDSHCGPSFISPSLYSFFILSSSFLTYIFFDSHRGQCVIYSSL